ncbi:hypothetical protein TYRP_005391 [Tyrophagus putrescentiae]|nr:hypothetical protein TYRP_005391 [Tyrophagus putrescentiae]
MRLIGISAQRTFPTAFPRLTPRPRGQTDPPSIVLPSELSVHKNLNSNNNGAKLPFFLELANLHRNASLSSLKLSISGGNFTGPLERLDEILWRLPLTSQLQIFIDRSKEENFTAYHFHWFGVGTSLDREVCLHIAHNNATWFSSIVESGSTGKGDWPMSRLRAISRGTGLVTGGATFGPTLEPLFLSSDGFALLLKHKSPWFIRRDPSTSTADPLLCLAIDANSAPYSRHHSLDYMSLEFSIIASSSLLQAHQGLLKAGLLLKPTSIPAEGLFTAPVWSVVENNVAQKIVNQTSVVTFAEQLKKYNLSASQIEISSWEKHLGDGTFDEVRFPNPAKMVEDLHKLGFKTSLLVTPFADSQSAEYSKSLPYLTKSASSSDSFKFDGGEVANFGADHLFANKTVQELPNLITSEYVKTCHLLGNSCDQFRAGFGTQALPLFLQLTVEPTAEGLKAVIPTALSLSIGGYPFLVAQMSAKNLSHSTASEELYIRLLQATTFFPAMSIISSMPASAHFANQTSSNLVNLTRKFINLHAEHAPTLVALARRTVQSGEPIVRPLWYGASFSTNSNAELINVNDQFMIGEDILVAPVVEVGQRSRTVHFPPGSSSSSSWIDQHGKSYNGGTKAVVQAPLEELPYFTRRQLHLLYDPVLTTHALKNSVSSYLLVIVSFGLMTLYSIYLDYMVFFRAVQWGPLFEEAALFHTGVPLLFNWRRPLASVKRVFRQAASLKRSPLAQENFSWGGFSGGPSKFFDRQTIGRGVALYQVLNVFFSGVLFFFAEIIIVMFFFVLRNVLEVLDRSSWSWRSQWILALAALDQLITCYIAWNSARISIAGVEAFLCAYYATSRQVALLSGDQERLLTTVRKIKENAASGSILGGSGPEVLNHQFSGGSSRMIVVDCFYASLALHRRQHRRLVVFAEALNSGLISPVLVATFLLNCLVNAAVLASFLYASLSTNDVIANLTILWFQVVNIGSVCTLCVRYSKALYRRLTPLSLQALNLSGPGQAVFSVIMRKSPKLRHFRRH